MHDYPQWRNTMNVYVGNSQLYVDEPCPKKEEHHKDYTQTLREWLHKESVGNQWKLTDENQQGMRGWFEFTAPNGAIAVIFLRSEQFCSLTNKVPSFPPEDDDTKVEYRIQKSHGQHLLLIRDQNGEYSAGNFDTKRDAEVYFKAHYAHVSFFMESPFLGQK